MTDYALTGKKGTGKSKHAVLIIRDQYFDRKRRVATNLDLNLAPMFGARSRQTYVRVPDKPSSFDLEAIGHGNPDSYDEDLNGALVLDEMATWLNTRSFNDKDRAAVLDYFAHARKHGFDTYYIMQDIVQVDKQLRESFIEQTVRHIAWKKVRIPFVGFILAALFGDRAGFLPPFHTASYRLGTNPQDMVTNSAMFRGKDVEKCYDTRQVFRADYPHGTHSVLSPWHVEGRFLKAEKSAFWSVLVRSLFRVRPAPRPALPSPRTHDPVAARAAWFARRLPVGRRAMFVSAYVRASTAIGASRAVEGVRSAPEAARSAA